MSPLSSSTSTCLFGKGFKNKQALLAQKLQLAKQQNKKESDSVEEVEEEEEVSSAEEDKKEEDDAHQEFARLLAKNPPKNPPNPTTRKEPSLYNLTPKKPKPISIHPKQRKTPFRKTNKNQPKGGQKKQAQEEDSTDDMVVLQVGDNARRRDFEPLMDPSTSSPLGPLRAAQLVPWVPPFLTDHLIVLADPRRQSKDLRLAMEYLQSSQQSTNKPKNTRIAIFPNDPPKDVLAWKERVDKDNHNKETLHAYLDSSSLDWMTTYACVDDWSLHLLIIDNDGIIQCHKSGIDPSDICQLVADSVAAIMENQ
ncbi:expressed unknown protein [Seminavis robusta]|uniref:Uncharacterized protein n=1 Tax=Seminavis robusta TaxID=568900 RepID=A0A9N8ENT4_9STRA|nr:expressed unknown protein [Seminavis robusta]|eukprot:Sro1449_g273670.1 n/a (309) ;mRNA; f:13806-14732